MFIRASSQKNKKTGQPYTTYRLVQTYRNQDGKVRQHTLLNLGCHFSVPQSQWKLLADRVEAIQRGQDGFLPIHDTLEKEAQRIAKLIAHKAVATLPIDDATPSSPSAYQADYQSVDVNSLDHRDVRFIGSEYVGYHAACQLGLEPLLRSLGFNKKQAHIALATIIGRLVYPGSDLSTHRYLRAQSALDELIGTDFSQLSLKQFYSIADQLYQHRGAIEQALYDKEKDLFHLQETVTLYDITNTYFEGRSLANDKAHYGRSKEKRSDCPLVSLGMVLDASGFPKKSRILPGNVSEPKTLQAMLDTLKTPQTATIVMDAGIATEENIAWLKTSGYEYIVVSRKRHLVMPNDTDTFTVKQDNNNQVQVALVKNTTFDEWELYCHSQAKEKKSLQVLSKMEARYESELNKLITGLQKKGCIKKYDKVIEKLGRLKEQYKKIARYYQVDVKPSQDNVYAETITWQKGDKPDNVQRGIYCLRTNKQDIDAHSFWHIYTMLTELEAAFRSLKSELGLRPIYHQKEARIDAHIFISILAYHLLHTLRYQLKAHHIHHSWQTLRELLSTQCRITSRMQLEDGRVLHIRKTSSPDTYQQAVYRALGITGQPGRTEKNYY